MKRTFFFVLILFLALAGKEADGANLVSRIGGETQYDTAARIAEAGWNTADTAVLAVGTIGNSSDALCAGPLAAQKNAPVLLTEGNVLTEVTQSTLQQLNVKKVYIIGGTGVVKANVEKSLQELGISVVRLAGYDAAETSVKVAQEMGNISGIVLAGGKGQDALSISPVAALKGYPILYTDNKEKLPVSISQYIDGRKDSILSSVVVGGTGVISSGQMNQLPGEKSRYGGYDAYDTNVEVIRGFSAVFKFNSVFVANGQTMVDALAGVPLAAKEKAPVLLTENTAVKALDFVAGKLDGDSKVTGLGGEAVVSSRILGLFNQSGSNPTEEKDVEVISVSALNSKELKVSFSKAVSNPSAVQFTVVKELPASAVVSGVTPEWSGDKKEVRLKSNADFPYGEYQVKVTGGNLSAWNSGRCSVISKDFAFSINEIPLLAGHETIVGENAYARKLEVVVRDGQNNQYTVDPANIVATVSSDESVAKVKWLGTEYRVFGQDIAKNGNTMKKKALITVTVNTVDGTKTLETEVTVSPEKPEIKELRFGYRKLGFLYYGGVDVRGEQTLIAFPTYSDAQGGEIVNMIGGDQYGVWRDVTPEPGDVRVLTTQYAPVDAFYIWTDHSITIDPNDKLSLRVNQNTITRNVDIVVQVVVGSVSREITVKLLH